MQALKGVAILLFFPAILLAQGQYGSISGTIRDASGAVIPGVSVAIVNVTTGHKVESLTLEEGRFFVPQLLPGTYEIRIDHPGFKRLSVRGLTLDINQNLQQDLILDVGNVNETVMVSADTKILETVSGSIGHVVSNKQIDELPLNGRNVFDLVSLTPGSMNIAADVSIGGGRTSSALATRA